MSRPTKIEVNAAISTAAAPTSLPTFAREWCCGLARSTTASKAVLMNSAVQTSAMVSNNTAQSRIGKRNQKATSTTSVVTIAWIQALRWVRTTYHQPRKAFRKACARETKKVRILSMHDCWRNSKPGQDFRLGCPHAGFFFRPRMVVTQQVQHPVDNQQR